MKNNKIVLLMLMIILMPVMNAVETIELEVKDIWHPSERVNIKVKTDLNESQINIYLKDKYGLIITSKLNNQLKDNEYNWVYTVPINTEETIMIVQAEAIKGNRIIKTEQYIEIDELTLFEKIKIWIKTYINI